MLAPLETPVAYTRLTSAQPRCISRSIRSRTKPTSSGFDPAPVTFQNGRERGSASG
jgi:hypothetical protein